jgi:SAM-dependent methyltransferase
LHLGCGGNKLPEPWSNYDIEVDIRQPLPFHTAQTQAVFMEHVLEHVPSDSAYHALREIHRVLSHDGKFRLIFPDPDLINGKEELYSSLLTLRDSKTAGAAERLMSYWGHKTLLCKSAVYMALREAGFIDIATLPYGEHGYDVFLGLDGHHKTVGRTLAVLESTVIECRK